MKSPESFTPTTASLGHLDSSEGESVGEAPGYLSKPFPTQVTELIQAKVVKAEVIVKVEREDNIKEEVNDEGLTLSFEALTVNTKKEEDDPSANDHTSVKDEDRPASPKRKGTSIQRGVVDVFLEQRRYFLALCSDLNLRPFCWSRQNRGISSVFYVDVEDQDTHKYCGGIVHDGDPQRFTVGLGTYISNYQTFDLFLLQPQGMVEVGPYGLEAILDEYRSLYPPLRPSSLTAYSHVDDFYLGDYDPARARVPERGDTSPQVPPTDETTAGLAVVFTSGVAGVTGSAPSPGPPSQAPDSPALVLIPDHPGRQKMILPEDPQTVNELEAFVQKVDAELKALDGRWRVECSKCGETPCNSKKSTLLRHILPHYGHRHVCDICLKDQSHQGNLGRHKRDKHFVCTSCEDQHEPFESAEKLKAHMKSVHSEECPDCKELFLCVAKHKRRCPKLPQVPTPARGAALRGIGGSEGGGSSRPRRRTRVSSASA